MVGERYFVFAMKRSSHGATLTSGNVCSGTSSAAGGYAEKIRLDIAAALGTRSECEDLGEKACLDSENCTLALIEERKQYQCRAVKNECEQGFRQRGGTQVDCEAKADCHYTPGKCYCEPDLTCICGGGPPPLCGVRNE